MSGYKTFAIWGAGNLGGRIAARLLERDASVIILSRPVGSTLCVVRSYSQDTFSRQLAGTRTRTLPRRGPRYERST
jgi:phosphoglycerate dehydrogenase-like enzyme